MLSFQSSLEDFLAASETDLVQYCQSLPRLKLRLKRLSSALVCKITPSWGFGHREYQTQIHARQLLNGDVLRVPQPVRFFTQDLWSYFIMEYIEGVTLEEEYRDDDDILERLVNIVLFMQSKTAPKPGPIDGGPAIGFPWGEGNLETELRSLFDLQSCVDRRLARISGNLRLDIATSSCVLTHGDFVPRNIIISYQNEIVLVDWERACYYPPLFEVSAIHYLQGLARIEHSGFFDKIVNRLLARLAESEERLQTLGLVQDISISNAF